MCVCECMCGMGVCLHSTCTVHVCAWHDCDVLGTVHVCL